MEIANKDKLKSGLKPKIVLGIYEFAGTALIMYAFMIGIVSSPLAYILMTFAMMMIAWDVSGGHFNPAITIGMWVAEKDFGGNLAAMGIMIVS